MFRMVAVWRKWSILPDRSYLFKSKHMRGQAQPRGDTSNHRTGSKNRRYVLFESQGQGKCQDILPCPQGHNTFSSAHPGPSPSVPKFCLVVGAGVRSGDVTVTLAKFNPAMCKVESAARCPNMNVYCNGRVRSGWVTGSGPSKPYTCNDGLPETHG